MIFHDQISESVGTAVEMNDTFLRNEEFVLWILSLISEWT